MELPAKYEVGALLRASDSRHWCVFMIVYSKFQRPRYVCFRNGKRRIFSELEFQ